MPTSTYVSLGTITLASTDSEIVFSSIPATYRDLILVYNGTNSDSSAGLYYRLNGDTNSANYTRVVMLGTAGGASSNTTPGIALGFGSTDRTTLFAQFMDYSATDKHKTTLTRSGTPNLVEAGAFRWANTAAVTSITVYRDTGATLSVGSTLSLFGVN